MKSRLTNCPFESRQHTKGSIWLSCSKQHPQIEMCRLKKIKIIKHKMQLINQYEQITVGELK